jgi:diaminopimelate epimerase
MNLHFTKLHGLGNDFIVVDHREITSRMTPEHAQALCDRHFGIGADGVLELSLTDGALTMIVYNADGSRPGMCGNGIRCVGRYLAQTGQPGPYPIQTDAGLRTVHHTADDRFRVEMGAVVDLGQTTVHSTQGRRLDVGNPHFVAFDQWSPEQPATLGPVLVHHEHLPGGANISFATFTGPHHINLTVWERGCGLTLACGTGACATAAAAWLEGRADPAKPLHITLPGGTLEIEGPLNAVQMTGPATWVFAGTWGTPA